MSDALHSRMESARFWWDGRSGREQMLLSLLAGLLVVLALWFGLVAPLRALNQAADERFEEAAAESAAVERLARQVAGGGAGGAAVLQSASAAGLSVSRQRADDQGLTIWIDSADPSAVLAWLDGVQKRQGLSPSALTMVSEANGVVRVEASFPVRS